MKIIVSHPFNNEDPRRQHPCFSEPNFEFNSESDTADIWLVHEDLPTLGSMLVNCRTVVLITSEPPLQRRYPQTYLRQFDLVVTAHPDSGGANFLNWHQCYPWHVGWDKSRNSPTGNPASSYVTLSQSGLPKKSKMLSVICSNESRLPGHRQRLNFVRKLKAEIGDQLEWFGRGVNPIADKWDGLAPYHYHLCMENSVLNHYWTEKISDAFLAGCMPIYWGAPNIASYFDPRGLEVIDLNSLDESLRRIKGLIQNVPKVRNLDAIVENRRRVMDEYNYWGLSQRIAENFPLGDRRFRKIHSLGRYRGKTMIFMERLRRLPGRLSAIIKSK